MCTCTLLHTLSVCPFMLTWLGSVRLAPLGTQAVLPTHCWVLDKAGDMNKELAEAHISCVVHCVVQQGRTPQVRLLPQQHTVQARQALLRGIGWLEAILLSTHRGAPGLTIVVHATHVVCAYTEKGRFWSKQVLVCNVHSTL